MIDNEGFGGLAVQARAAMSGIGTNKMGSGAYGPSGSRAEPWPYFFALYPPNLQIYAHCSAVTGVTDNRLNRISEKSANTGSTFICANVTGVGNGRTARMSTHDQSPSVAVGSG